MALVALAVACSRDAEPVDEPSRLALSLFELARSPAPDETRLAAVIEPGGPDRDRAALYDALGRLREAGRPEVRRVDHLEDLGRVVVEVVCRLDGDAEELYTVQLEPDAEGRLRVTGFDGPGVSWPPRGRSTGPGLSSRPEP